MCSLWIAGSATPQLQPSFPMALNSQQKSWEWIKTRIHLMQEVKRLILFYWGLLSQEAPWQLCPQNIPWNDRFWRKAEDPRFCPVCVEVLASLHFPRKTIWRKRGTSCKNVKKWKSLGSLSPGSLSQPSTIWQDTKVECLGALCRALLYQFKQTEVYIFVHLLVPSSSQNSRNIQKCKKNLKSQK